MSKREEFKLKAGWCQQILMTCLSGRASFPKKWGEKPIPDDEQLIGREDLGDLMKALRAYSQWLQGIGEDYRQLFGDKDNWRPIGRDGKHLEGLRADDERVHGYEIVDQERWYTLRLNREALSGVVWCCILRLHPHGIVAITTKDATDVWWPIAEAIGKATAIRKYMGLASAKRTDWEDDAEPAASTEEKK